MKELYCHICHKIAKFATKNRLYCQQHYAESEVKIMTKVYLTKDIPKEVQEWFKQTFFDMPNKKYTFKFYTYNNKEGAKIYGCDVFENSKPIHNATEDTLEQYKKCM